MTNTWGRLILRNRLKLKFIAKKTPRWIARSCGLFNFGLRKYFKLRQEYEMRNQE